jgi:bis(5'-adenosyl)-triphosphatase
MNISACPFCHNQVQSSVFYEYGEFLSLYNIAPVLPGHSLVIPKAHIVSILDLNDTQFTELFFAARKTLNILIKAFRTDAFNWSIQEKYESGQTIEHLHLHILPRTINDLPQPGDWYPLLEKNDTGIIDSTERLPLNDASLFKIVDKLRSIAKEVI